LRSGSAGEDGSERGGAVVDSLSLHAIAATWLRTAAGQTKRRSAKHSTVGTPQQVRALWVTDEGPWPEAGQRFMLGSQHVGGSRAVRRTPIVEMTPLSCPSRSQVSPASDNVATVLEH